MCCVVSVESLDLPPEGGQVFRAVAFPICTSANEHTAMSAISPRLVTRLRSRGNRNRRRRGVLLGPWGFRGEGEGRRSIILSVLVGVVNRFGLRGGGCIGERPSDWNKREMRGSVSNLDGTRCSCAGEDGSVDDCGGCLNGGAGRKCLLGARYLGGGGTVAGEHLLRVDGTGILGHGSMIIVAVGGREA